MPIVRYDCTHGFFHRDVLNPNGSKEKKAIGIKDLEDALLYAEQDLKDRWEFYKEKYLKKKKMNNKEYAERNIGLTFDFLRQVSGDPSILESIPDGAIIEFIDKDYSNTEYPQLIKPNRFFKVKNQFELID